MKRFTIKSLGHGSERYGNCEICKNRASEMYRMVEERRYEFRYTRQGCRETFGHENCIQQMMRDMTDAVQVADLTDS